MRLDIDIVGKAFEGASGKRHEVLAKMRFSLAAGEVLVIVGPADQLDPDTFYHQLSGD